MNPQALTSQLKSLSDGLSLTQKASIALALLAVAGGLAWFTTRQNQKDYRAAFTGMSAEDAGAVVAKLKESAVDYRIGDNGTSVLVSASKVDEVRLQMAAAGLPRTGRVGFELFDKTSLASSNFAEQVNFRRALEGELERSIRSITEVEQARVHLSPAKDSVFTESKEPAKASVLLTLRPGAQVSDGTVRAVVHLVASAVEGLNPQMVSVTDSGGNLLNKPKKTNTGNESSDELIEFREKLERDLTTKVVSTLEPLLGTGKFRVGMSVDCDFTSGEQSEELYDPEKSVMVTTQKSEETSGSATAAGGVPGTPSSLPKPAPKPAGTSGGTTRRTENVTYQTSHTVRRTRLPQGNIRRISVSVLLDQGIRWETQNGKQQRVLVPPSEESMQGIREVVAATVGLVPNRGDQLVVRSLPFEMTLAAPPPGSSAPTRTAGAARTPENPIQTLLQDPRIMTGVAAGIVVLLAGIVWLVMRSRRKGRIVQSTARVNAPASLPEAAADAPALPGDEESSKLLAEAKRRVIKTVQIEAISDKLRSGIGTDPILAASVLRSWLDEGDRVR